jgi:hypothetical protein
LQRIGKAAGRKREQLRMVCGAAHFSHELLLNCSNRCFVKLSLLAFVVGCVAILA